MIIRKVPSLTVRTSLKEIHLFDYYFLYLDVENNSESRTENTKNFHKEARGKRKKSAQDYEEKL